MSPPANPSARVGAEAVEREVLVSLTPDTATAERVRRTTERLVERANLEARGRPVRPDRILVAGSAARDTYLNDRFDIDLFLLYSPSLSRADLEKEGMALAGAILTEGETRYAEHPYLRGKFDGFPIEAVPGYAVTDPSQPMSAVDRTPFHQEYLRQRQTPEMTGQVRLLKQFLRAHGLYGSDARTGGLSGYLVELLVLKLGSFRGVLEAASRWRIPVRLLSAPGISPRVPEDVALVVDDPVDPHRNVATALTRRNLATLILAGQSYLANPRVSAFEPQPPGTLGLAEAQRRIHDRGTHVLAVRLRRPPAVDDILYPQIRKAQRGLADEAGRLGFAVLGTAGEAGEDHVLILIEVATPTLPAVRVRHGPPAGIDRVGSFLEKWSQPGGPVLQGPYVGEDGNLAVETRQGERSVEPLLREALPRIPIGRDLRALPDSDAWVGPLDQVQEAPELSRALSQLLDKRLPWRRSPPLQGKDVQEKEPDP